MNWQLNQTNMKRVVVLLLALSSLGDLKAQFSPLETFYEKSSFKETPRYSETIDYCKQLAELSSMVQYRTFGKSGLGYDLPLLIISKNKRFTPADALKSRNTVVWIQACIHPGEPDGKDAGLMLIRDIVTGRLNNHFIDDLTILFIPILNVDGHERFGPYNRINQNGPSEMGWRANASNLNLNRDHLKIDSPELRAWLALFNQWNPHFFIDTHTTNGADYQYPITYSMETGGSMDKLLTMWQQSSFIPTMEAEMDAMGTPIFHYVSFRRWHDPRSGIAARVAPPMLSQGYTALRNRPGLLVETHMLKDYKTRVDATYNILKFSLEFLSKNGKTLQNLIIKADLACSYGSLRQNPFPLQFNLTSDSTMLMFKGVEYTVETSDLTGGQWFKYSNVPAEFPVPFFNQNAITKTARLPLMYVVPPNYTDVIERIRAHGISFTTLKKEQSVSMQYYYINDVAWGTNPYEGRIRLTRFRLTDTLLTRNVPAGSLLIPLDQPLARVVAHILEPYGPDSYLSWGFFNSIFEQKEYAENYVMEKMARQMLEESPELRLEFEELKRTNPELAANQWGLLNWFYRKTLWWDANINLYPVGRIYDAFELIKFQ